VVNDQPSMSAAQANAADAEPHGRGRAWLRKGDCAASVRVNADGRQVWRCSAKVRLTPEFNRAEHGNTFYPNTLADNTGTTTDSDDGTRCTQGAAEVCTLRDCWWFCERRCGGQHDPAARPTRSCFRRNLQPDLAGGNGLTRRAMR